MVYNWFTDRLIPRHRGHGAKLLCFLAWIEFEEAPGSEKRQPPPSPLFQ